MEGIKPLRTTGCRSGGIQGTRGRLQTGWKESLSGKNWELTIWCPVTCWRKLVEAVNQYPEKGSWVFLEGELRGDASEPLDKHRCHS